MSRPRGPIPSLFQFENNFRMMLPRGSYMSPHLISLLNSFEEKLAHSLKKLMAITKDSILSMSWMKLAMESLCETHNDIKALIVDLDLPVSDWDEGWTDVYLNNSMKLLDLCNAFSSEISRLSQGNLILQCALQNMDSDTPKFGSVHHSLSKWKHHAIAKNPGLESCTVILESFAASLNLPKVRNSPKGKVLMHAIYGFKVKTLFISSIFTAAFSCSPKKLVDLHVPETLPWADTFARLQLLIYGEIRIKFQSSSDRAIPVLKELEAVDASIINFLRISQADNIQLQPDVLQSMSIVSDLRKSAEKLSHALDLLSTEVDNFFRIVLAGRDTLLCSLRSHITISNSPMKAAQAVK
ncbi:unnamed protein product [Rhodiola kirilowii]